MFSLRFEKLITFPEPLRLVHGDSLDLIQPERCFSRTFLKHDIGCPSFIILLTILCGLRLNIQAMLILDANTNPYHTVMIIAIALRCIDIA